MTPSSYPCPLAGGGTATEYALVFDRGRKPRVLIVPALFDEANRMRRLTVEVMRRLDTAGIDSFLPDLPGCNESLQDLRALDPEDWRTAMAAAARHFAASHVLAIRGGALVLPTGLPGWIYAPVKGASLLRQMLRARIVASREAGREETQEGLLETGSCDGLELAGYRLGPEFLRQFQTLGPVQATGVMEMGQDMIGGAGLWLRAEPGEDAAQADALASVIHVGIRA